MPLSGRALHCDEDIFATIPHANSSDIDAVDLTVIVRRGQGTHLRALAATDEDGRNIVRGIGVKEDRYGWLRD